MQMVRFHMRRDENDCGCVRVKWGKKGSLDGARTPRGQNRGREPGGSCGSRLPIPLSKLRECHI